MQGEVLTPQALEPRLLRILKGKLNVYLFRGTAEVRRACSKLVCTIIGFLREHGSRDVIPLLRRARDGGPGDVRPEAAQAVHDVARRWRVGEGESWLTRVKRAVKRILDRRIG